MCRNKGFYALEKCCFILKFLFVHQGIWNYEKTSTISMISTLIRDCGDLDQLHCKLLAFSSVNTDTEYDLAKQLN